MEDPYWRYGASADGGSIPRSSFPGYLSSEPSALTSHHPSLTPHPGAYGLDDIMGTGMRAEPGLSGLTAGASIRGYPPLQDPVLLGQRPDLAVGIGSGIPDLINGRPGSLARVDGIPVPARESNILFVDGLPSDSSRREVGPLFQRRMSRPAIVVELALACILKEWAAALVILDFPKHTVLFFHVIP
ncbi:hypothetical protein RHSIM_Rhsim07G0160100 [Rhododendron simsii]|uniref:Uncharacterized protein n=1 Tax=Rhododendron simsii TaxID=118357 RepID=A0A834LJM2_RHOSS|nr:hypothetical protein RHSIM_Rhsim07G0160100 [Rhododendron simsii]